MSTQERGLRTILGAILLCAITALLPNVAGARHAPSESVNCTQCHTFSRGAVIPGTRLIRSDSFLTTLQGQGKWSVGNPLPCLYCHRAGNSGTARMKAVDAHFSDVVSSKHSVNIESGFANSGTTFDCLDCHSGAGAANFTQYVDNTGGDERVHGISTTSGATVVNLTNTLIVNIAYSMDPAAGNYTRNCMATACHGGAINNTYATGKTASRA
ncbi:hypothetical protein FDZ71_02090, partial [bacterium]